MFHYHNNLILALNSNKNKLLRDQFHKKTKNEPPQEKKEKIKSKKNCFFEFKIFNFWSKQFSRVEIKKLSTNWRNLATTQLTKQPLRLLRNDLRHLATTEIN